jgi:HAE1 family hydrophobic/amphiphilic exporter-1
MTLADLSIKRPTFITAVIVLMIAGGLVAMRSLGVDLFPNITFPVVTVTTPYPGAGPSEIESLVSKPIEDELSTLSGMKRLSSISQEGVSIVVAEFTLETDVKFAEQQIRDRVSATKRKLPTDVKEPTIRRIDPADQPVVIVSVAAENMDTGKLYDLANEVIRPRLEQVSQVGLVEVIGGRKREIRVSLDRDKLKRAELSAGFVSQRLAATGENVPVGTVEQNAKETVLRTIGQFTSLKDIEKTLLNLFGNDVPVTIKDVGSVVDTLADEKSRTYVNGKQSLLIYAFRQSGANTIAVVDGLKKRIEKINIELASDPHHPKLEVVRDGSTWIRANVDDVKESILIGIVLAMIVVYLFLANGRSTIITGLALPNSLIGAFILMAAAGFSINIMTLLALSLSVGLLVDDAIVVRENIFRHIELGKAPKKAAREGTLEVTLAVVATTFTVIAVFGPVGFLKGVVGQFFREFGLTICFAMLISLFDALTIAPMLSAYFAGKRKKDEKPGTLFSMTIGPVLNTFSRFQDRLEDFYERLLKYTVKNPFKVLGVSTLIFILSMASGKFVPKTFLPTQDAGEFTIAMDLPPGTSLERMAEVAEKVDGVIRANSEVHLTALTIGNREGAANVADAYVKLIPAKQRKLNTSGVKEKIREQLKEYAYVNPKVKDYDPVGGGMRPFTLNFIGDDQQVLETYAQKFFAKFKDDKALKDVDLNFRPGKPEFQVVPNAQAMQRLGISTLAMGGELRAQVEGITPVRYREGGREYDVRVRLKDDQRDLREAFNRTWIPNVNGSLVSLSSVAKGLETQGPSKVNRQDRARYVQVGADIAPGGGLGDIMNKMKLAIETDPELKLPAGVTYAFVGQAENFQELATSMMVAMGFGALFIFLVLASLYESFVTPFTIMLALPLAFCGSLVALAITQESLNIFSMIGVIMLLGVATKNSILLVDYTNHLVREENMDPTQALIRAGRVRLRPILMTTMALIAGTLPVALGLNEASRQRTSMGVAIIGGLISSTLLTLVVVPAAYQFIERFRVWSKGHLSKVAGVHTHEADLLDGEKKT